MSNSNTPRIIDLSNPVTTAPTYREIAQINYNIPIVGNTITPSTTTTNAYSGNNGRAAILANGNYFTVGNAGNGSNKINGGTAPASITSGVATGVQIVAAGTNATASTATQNVGSFNVTQYGYPADKTAKDNNSMDLVYLILLVSFLRIQIHFMLPTREMVPTMVLIIFTLVFRSGFSMGLSGLKSMI